MQFYVLFMHKYTSLRESLRCVIMSVCNFGPVVAEGRDVENYGWQMLADCLIPAFVRDTSPVLGLSYSFKFIIVALFLHLF